MRCWIAVALFLGIATAVQAKPVAATSLSDALEKASVICAATCVGHEFDDLKSGQTVERDGVDGFSKRWRVTEVWRDGGGRVKVGQVLTVRDKTNACIVETWVVRFEGGAVVMRQKTPRDSAPAQEIRVKTGVGRKAILLLDAEMGHYGWFASPQDDTAAVREQLKVPGAR